MNPIRLLDIFPNFARIIVSSVTNSIRPLWRDKLPQTKSILLATATILVASITTLTTANARPSTQTYTCEGVKNYIYNRGAVVMNHKASHLYRRFVANSSYCKSGYPHLKPFSVPTKSGRCSLRICTDLRRFIRHD
ncbi:hypothetical protein JYT43_00860 [Ahrensia sp. AH-315-G08]|nr:hypothetical protein [Ahrensia sp. AH-315-G08]